MGDEQIILKNLRDTSFNKDLSNEPTFKFILFIEPKYCKHIIDHTIFIIFLW